MSARKAFHQPRPELAERALAKRDAEIKNLKAALEWCSEIVFAGMDIDGGDFQDEMVRLGLLIAVPASEQQKAEYDVDEMLDWVWK